MKRSINNLTSDTIAIDANVLRHLMNPQNNVDGHIGVLLKRLIQDGIQLLVDDQKEIGREYEYQILRRAENMEEGRAERILLLYWLNLDNHRMVTVDMTGKLMSDITEVVPVKNGADRFYIYVAFKKNRILITNDKKDILNQRGLLAQIGPQCAYILSSQDAHDRL